MTSFKEKVKKAERINRRKQGEPEAIETKPLSEREQLVAQLKAEEKKNDSERQPMREAEIELAIHVLDREAAFKEKYPKAE